MLAYLESCFSIAYARKESAHAKWTASGYRDLEARAQFERWFDACQRLMPAIRRARGRG